MGVKFTQDQQKAIDTLDKSVLVAAAAGSGKTAVLVERIIKIVLEGRANVDELLIVTFTKAAAAEMRVKISRAIKKRMKEDPANRARLKEQLDRLYRAYISTFDSFAVRVIKEFFYQVDIEPNFKACDEIQSTLLKRDAVDRLFEDCFADDSLVEGCSFREFLRLYSSDRSEETIKETLIEAYDNLRSMPNYFEWACDKAELLNADNTNDVVQECIRRECMDALKVADEGLSAIMELYESNGIEDKFGAMLGDEQAVIAQLEEKAESGTIDKAFIDTINNMEFKSLQAYTQFFSKDENEKKKAYASFRTQITPLRNTYKDKFVSLRKKYFLPDYETRLREMHETYRYTVYFINLLKKLEEYYQLDKKDRGLIDFADMEHTAVSILEDPSAGDTLRRRFKYIFIDEYQDTNNIQEYLISLISRRNNVFKVGDVKQSIYRFRQAEPAIFQQTYEEYSSGENDDAIAIDLNRNFRSNDRTLAYINHVFADVMEGYDDRARLYTGITDIAEYPDEYDYKPEVHVLNKDMAGASGDDADSDRTGNETADAQTVVSEDVDGEIESITKEEAEAAYVTGLIDSIIGTEFYDSVQQKVRRAEARDIAVLAKSVKRRGEMLTRTLRTINVQAHIEDDDNFFDTVEVGIAIALFSCIDNMKRDIPLISTLHSEVFGWSPEELAQVRIESRQNVPENADKYNSRVAYWEALLWYTENGTDDALAAKARFALEKLQQWRELSNMMPLEDFIWKVLVDSGYYLKVGAMYGGDRRQANLRVLVDRARKFTEDSVAGLSAFIDYVEVMKSKGVKNGQTSMVGKDDDVVRITTIHKSKGLEYPFVIVCAMGTKFRNENNSMGFSFDSRTGLGLSYVSPDRKFWRSSLMQLAITQAINDEAYREHLRVLYVAMTRARNKLYLVGVADSRESICEARERPANFLSVIGEKIDTPYNELHMVPLVEKVHPDAGNRVGDLLKSRPKNMTPEVLETYEEVCHRLDYRYPEEDTDTKSKFSVSELRRKKIEESLSRPDDEVAGLLEMNEIRKKASAADIGIAYHRIMEFIDFTKVCGTDGAGEPDADYIKERAEFLRDNNAIEEHVYDRLRMGHVEQFFKTDIGRRAVEAALSGKLKKEKPFTLKTEWQGREILVQGVIDCCWEEDGRMILLDYKSSSIRRDTDYGEETERIKKEYQTQVDLYAEAITCGTGRPVEEAYLYLFLSGDPVSVPVTQK